MAAMTPPVELVLRSCEVMPEIARLVDVAPVAVRLVAKRLVVVAFVVVELFIVRPLMVDDAAWTVMPMVVVGESEPPDTFQSLKAVPM